MKMLKKGQIDWSIITKKDSQKYKAKGDDADTIANDLL